MNVTFFFADVSMFYMFFISPEMPQTDRTVGPPSTSSDAADAPGGRRRSRVPSRQGGGDAHGGAGDEGARDRAWWPSGGPVVPSGGQGIDETWFYYDITWYNWNIVDYSSNYNMYFYITDI